MMKMTAKKLKGVLTALSVPFRPKGEIERALFKKLVKYQVSQGVDGFVVNGTTGESPCLSLKEQEELFMEALGSGDSKPLIVGVGGNSTHKVLEQMAKPFLRKANGFLTVVPYYNKPPQRGLIKHFLALADKDLGPLILYNVPSRTGQNLSLKSVVTLSHHPQIIGIKEASGDVNFGKQILEATDPEEFSVLSGDDDTWLELCAQGAKGVISVVSHIIAPKMKDLLRQVQKGTREDIAQALKTYQEIYGPLLKALYAETNPIGIKMALKLIGLFETANMRPPLVEMEEPQTLQLKETLQQLKLC